MKYSNISKLRKILVEEISNIQNNTPILLTLDEKLLKELFFCEHEFASEIISIIERIDFSNISFNGFNARNYDFSKLHGVKIDPQKIFEKNLINASCDGVEFIDGFDDVKVSGAIFKGSIDAIINPQTIHEKDLSYGIFTDVTFDGSFDGVKVVGADFTGSIDAIIDPQKIKDKDFSCTNCRNIIFTNDFDGVNIENAKLDGSNYEEVINYEEEFRKKVKSIILKKKM